MPHYHKQSQSEIHLCDLTHLSCEKTESPRCLRTAVLCRSQVCVVVCACPQGRGGSSDAPVLRFVLFEETVSMHRAPTAQGCGTEILQLQICGTGSDIADLQ